MVDEPALGEEGEGVKQLEDGVARLVDGHDHDATTMLNQTAGKTRHDEWTYTWFKIQRVNIKGSCGYN